MLLAGGVAELPEGTDPGYDNEGTAELPGGMTTVDEAPTELPGGTTTVYEVPTELAGGTAYPLEEPPELGPADETGYEMLMESVLVTVG